MCHIICLRLHELTSCWPNYTFGERTTKSINDYVLTNRSKIISSVLFRDGDYSRIAYNHWWGKVFSVTHRLLFFSLQNMIFMKAIVVVFRAFININPTPISKTSSVQSVCPALAIRTDCISCTMTVSLCLCFFMCWSRCLLKYLGSVLRAFNVKLCLKFC